MPLSQTEIKSLASELAQVLEPAIRAAFFDAILHGSPNAQNAGSSVTVGTSSTLIVNYNPDRLVCTIVNNGLTDVYLAKGSPAQTNSGILLKANGGSYSFGRGTDDKYTGPIYGISSASDVVVVTEVNV